MRTDVAIVGAGPYGLSAAAHLRARGVRATVYGEPMGYWRRHMPAGMCLKSPWRASSIGAAAGPLSLAAYEGARGRSLDRPVPLADFIAYGDWYRQMTEPDLDPRRVDRIERVKDGFRLTLADGDGTVARSVVVSVGLHGSARRPYELTNLPADRVSHTEDHARLDGFAGRRLLVLGAGQSALESAVLAHEAGASVRVLVRAPEVHWLVRKASLDAGRGRHLYSPHDVGPAGLSWVVAFPELMRRLPVATRQRIVTRCVRPAPTAWLLARAGGIEVSCGRTISAVAMTDAGAIRATLDDASTVEVDHILTGTGFAPRVSSLSLLAPALQTTIAHRSGLPLLGDGFESSVPGLHILGALSVGSFGPLTRFVAGTWYTAPALAHAISRVAPRISPRLASASATTTSRDVAERAA